MENTGITLNEEGKEAFQKGKFEKAAEFFQQAADAHNKAENPLDAAEALNNLSVTLVKLKRAEEALQAVEGTDKIFEEAGDLLRKGMALGNKAAALEALGNTDEAIALYEESIKLFHEIGEDEYKTAALQAISEIKLRQGQISSTAMDALDALVSNPKPNFLQRILKFFMRRFAKL